MGVKIKKLIFTLIISTFIIPIVEASGCDIVDDFESYDDFCNRIYYTWIDGWGYLDNPDCGIAPYGGNGCGSTIGHFNPPFAEQTIIHGGGQSMPFFYNNANSPYYSETERTFEVQDWTGQGLTTLSIWFYGNANNAPEQLFIGVEDTTGNVAMFNHPDPNAALTEIWTEWNIDLKKFSDAGVNLKSIKKMYISFGDSSNPQPGGTGVAYFDDIMLCQPPDNYEIIIDLKQGWNLISFPLNLTNKSIKNIFKNINFSSIFSYGSWLYYFNETNNNFNTINQSKGYWINSLENQILTVEGKEIENPAINLNKGWNLIGYPYLEEKDISELFENNRIYAYNRSWISYIPNRTVNSLQKLKAGYGYWVEVRNESS